MEKAMFDQIKIDLCSIEDMKSLEKAYHSRIVQGKIDDGFSFYHATDMANLSGASSTDNYYLSNTDLDNKYGVMHDYLGTINSTEFGNIAKRDFNQFNRSFIIRPVLDFSDAEDLFNQLPFSKPNEDENKYDYALIKLGYAPRYAANSVTIQAVLEDCYKSHNYTITNDKYTFDKTYYRDYKTKFTPLVYPVYSINGKKYIRWKVFQCFDNRDIIDKITFTKSSSIYLSNNAKYYNGDYVWIEVTKIPWIVDIKRKRLIAREGLLSGIQFNDYCKKLLPIDYPNSNIKWFMNTYMKNELLKNEKILTNNSVYIKNENENITNNEINTIINKIQEYKKYYLGDINVDEKVNSLLINYNNSLDELSKKVEYKTSELSISTKNPKYLFNKLIIDLNDLLFELKSNGEKVKNYHDMIDILNECNSNLIDPSRDEICETVYTIKKIINDFITNQKAKNKLNYELTEIINNNIQRNMSYIEEFKHNDNIRIKTLDELKLEFRKDLQPFLEDKISKTVIKQDVVNEIMNNVKEMIDNHFIESKNKIVKNYLNILNQIIIKIKSIGNEEDKNKIREIVKLDFDATLDIDQIVKKLEIMIINSYKVLLDINERIEKHNEIDSYRYNSKLKY